MQKFFLIATFAAFSFGVADTASAVVHSYKQVRTVYPSSDDCLYFQLEGVSPPDYFAIPATHPNQKLMATVLLAALLSGKRVWVSTTGNQACGNEDEVEYIIIHK